MSLEAVKREMEMTVEGRMKTHWTNAGDEVRGNMGNTQRMGVGTIFVKQCV